MSERLLAERLFDPCHVLRTVIKLAQVIGEPLEAFPAPPQR
jgi:hypothetical protein